LAIKPIYRNNISEYYGITQDLATQDFMIIMPYYNSGDLIHYISSDFYNIKWIKKLENLKYIAKGLINIHSVDIIHRDLHSGNIFYEDAHWPRIGDLGISKSATESTDNKENYGIIPYMAPEIFQGQKYTKASDIYSFGMIMWVFMTGRRPFWDRNHDIELIIDISDGLRPPIVTNAPESYIKSEGYIELMKECWNSDPDKRPQATDLYNKINKIHMEERYNRYNNPTKIIHSSDIGPVKTNHSGAIYKSRPLSSMINSAMSLWSLRSQSIKVKRKFEDDLIEIDNVNGMLLTQLQIKFLKIYKTLRRLLKNKLTVGQSKRRKELFENENNGNNFLILLYQFHNLI
jgi:serine/threonine protein kinase